MRINISKEAVGRVVKAAGKCFVVGALAMLAPRFTTNRTVEDVTYYVGEVGYSDTVNVILNSSMLDYRKTEAITLLKRDGDSEYYKTVVSAVNSDMLDYRKLEIIRMLSK